MKIFLSNKIFIFLILLSSCQKTPTAEYPYTAEVLYLDGVNSEGSPVFRVGPKTFSTLRDLAHLDGDYLKLMQGGDFALREINGSIIEPESFSGGEKPLLRYRVKNGVIVPNDYTTLAMLSAYYQFDYLFSQLNEKFQISISDLFLGQNKTRFEAFFEPKISLDNSSASADTILKSNAAFAPQSWQFILYRRSAIEKLPLAANLQVIAHEFGHSLFQKYFYGGVYSEDNRFEKEYALLGINEGFADFVSFVFTGSSDILRASMDFTNTENQKNIADERVFSLTTFSYAEVYSSQYSSPSSSPCLGEFYCIGTIFARGLWESMNELSQKNIITQREYTASSLKSLSGVLDYIQNRPIPDSASSTPLSNSASSFDRWVISYFLNKFIENMPTSTHQTLCANFTKETSFGTLGYPTEFRTTCKVETP